MVGDLLQEYLLNWLDFHPIYHQTLAHKAAIGCEQMFMTDSPQHGADSKMITFIDKTHHLDNLMATDGSSESLKNNMHPCS